jgi:hypothetical protein
MSEKLTSILLSGLTPDEFLIYYGIALVGIFARWLYNVSNSILFDPSTPYRFSWRFFAKGLIRLLLSFIVMAFVIARFHEFSDHLVDITFQGEENIKANITATSAFSIGIGIDEIVKRMVARTVKHPSK